jgi:hypothetical protein
MGGAIMTWEADVRMLDLRIKDHSNYLKELRVKRAMMARLGTWELDQEIDRHERWRSIHERLRNLLAKEQTS